MALATAQVDHDIVLEADLWHLAFVPMFKVLETVRQQVIGVFCEGYGTPKLLQDGLALLLPMKPGSKGAQMWLINHCYSNMSLQKIASKGY